MTAEERIKIYNDEITKYPNPESFIETDFLIDMGFFTAPASTKYHGAYEGGLFDHSWAVYQRLKKLTEDNHLNWGALESPFVVGIYHDLCKCDQYIKKYDPVEDRTLPLPGKFHYEYNNNMLLKGHGDKSIMLISQFISLTEVEMLCIRYHMGAYMTDDWDGFDRAIRKSELVLWTHHADQLASKIDGV